MMLTRSSVSASRRQITIDSLHRQQWHTVRLSMGLSSQVFLRGAPEMALLSCSEDRSGMVEGARIAPSILACQDSRTEVMVQTSTMI